MIKKLLPLFLLCSVASATTYYEKTTIPPTITANTVLCNATALKAAPTACTAFIIVAGATDNSSITRTGVLAGSTQALKITNTFSSTPGAGTGAAIASVTVNSTLNTVGSDFDDLLQALSTNLTLATSTSSSSVSHQAFVAKTQKNSCYPASSCTKGYIENLIFNDYTGLPTSGGSYLSGGMVGSELDFRANDTDAAGNTLGVLPASLGIRTPLDVVYKSYIPITPSTPVTVTGASGTGVTATLTFSSQSLFPQIGSTIIVAGMTPAGYNTAGSVVTASTATTVSYANTTTGFTSGGTVSLPATVFGWGYRLSGQSNDTLTVNRGYTINNLTIGAAGYTTEYATQGTNASAFRMAGGQNIGFDTDTGSGATAYAKHTLSYDEGNSWLAYSVSGTAKSMIDDNGSVYGRGFFSLTSNALLLGPQSYGTSVTVGNCGAVTCKNSILLAGSGAGVAPSIKTLATGTTQTDLNLLLAPADAAVASGLNGGALTIRGGAGDGAGTVGAISLQASINGATNIGTGTSTGTTTIGNTAATGSALAINAPTTFSFGTSVSAASWATTSPVFNAAAVTLNDTTASGTDATEVAYSIQAPVFTSTGGAATTITNPETLWVGLPTCSGGVVCTTPFAAFFNGATKVNGLFIASGATLSGATNINASVNNATNINTGTNNTNLTLGGTTAGNVVNVASIHFRVGNVDYASVTAPTINSHFNTSSDSITASSTAAFKVTVGTGTGTSTGSLTMPTASNGWACSVNDVTTPASHNVVQTASSTTGVTVTDYSRTLGTAQNFANSDVLVFLCGAF